MEGVSEASPGACEVGREEGPEDNESSCKDACDCSRFLCFMSDESNEEEAECTAGEEGAEGEPGFEDGLLVTYE